MITNAVIFGASGFIGTRLTADITRLGGSVVAIDIAEPRQRLAGVTYLTADVRQQLSSNLAARGSVIYNLAAVHRTPGHPANEYYETNVLGAQNVTRFADDVGASQIVFTSSISVYGPSESVIDEASPLTPISDYGRSKVMAEEIHRRWCLAAPHRRLVTVRPGVVFGPGEQGNFTRLAKALRSRTFVYAGRKSTIKSGGYVDELIRALDFALAHPDPDTTFNFAYPDEYTMEDIVQAFGRVAGFPDRYPVIPAPALLAAAYPFELAGKIGLKTSIHRERIWKMINSTRIRPGWLLANGYAFGSDMDSALAAWAGETDRTFV